MLSRDQFCSKFILFLGKLFSESVRVFEFSKIKISESYAKEEKSSVDAFSSQVRLK